MILGNITIESIWVSTVQYYSPKQMLWFKDWINSGSIGTIRPLVPIPKAILEKKHDHTMWGPQTIAKLVYNSNNYGLLYL
jgi:hypothetical protein